MVGTGPFKFKEWTPADHVTIEKNADYWNAEAVPTSTRSSSSPRGPGRELNALEAGDIDLAQTIAPIDIASLSSNADLQVIDRGESCNVGGLRMNQTYKPIDNPKIRQADRLRDQQAGATSTRSTPGSAEPADNWMPPGTQYYKPLGLPTYDPREGQGPDHRASPA